MKLLTLILLFFFSIKSYSQNITSNLVFGSSYTNVPMVIKRSDGGWEVRGDSLSAIKLLWKEIERRDSSNSVQVKYMMNIIDDLIKERRRMLDGLNKIQKQLKPNK